MNSLKIEDLPREVKNGIMKRVHEHPKYISLAETKAMYIRMGNYMLAMQVSKSMADIETECLEAYIRNYEDDVKKVSELTDCMSREDKEYITALGNSLVMLADVLETLTIETNELLKKYHPSYRVEMFDTLNNLATEAKSHVRKLDEYKSDVFYTNLYGDTVDKLTDMIINKGKSFTRKVKQHYAKQSETLNK